MLGRDEPCEGCGTGAAEAEEDGHVAVGSLVGGGVEAELAAQRHLVHHEREDALLHLARVLRPQDDHLRPRVAKALRGRRRRGARGRGRRAGVGAGVR
eukprot:2937234-Prymnesium_polylepis.1